MGEGPTRHYRCHVGHSFSEKELDTKQSETIEHTLWLALRMMEERKLLLHKIARQHDQIGLTKLSASYKNRAEHLAMHVEKMKKLLFAIQKE